MVQLESCQNSELGGYYTVVYLGPFTYVAEDFALPTATASSVQPPVHHSTVGSRAFSVAGLQVGNCLPP